MVNGFGSAYNIEFAILENASSRYTLLDSYHYFLSTRSGIFLVKFRSYFGKVKYFC